MIWVAWELFLSVKQYCYFVTNINFFCETISFLQCQYQFRLWNNIVTSLNTNINFLCETISLPQYQYQFSLGHLCKILSKQSGVRTMFAQSSHKMCNSWVNHRIFCAIIYPKSCVIIDLIILCNYLSYFTQNVQFLAKSLHVLCIHAVLS